MKLYTDLCNILVIGSSIKYNHLSTLSNRLFNECAFLVIRHRSKSSNFSPLHSRRTSKPMANRCSVFTILFSDLRRTKVFGKVFGR